MKASELQFLSVSDYYQSLTSRLKLPTKAFAICQIFVDNLPIRYLYPGGIYLTCFVFIFFRFSQVITLSMEDLSPDKIRVNFFLQPEFFLRLKLQYLRKTIFKSTKFLVHDRSKLTSLRTTFAWASWTFKHSSRALYHVPTETKQERESVN